MSNPVSPKPRGNGLMLSGVALAVLGIFFILLASATRDAYGNAPSSPGGVVFIILGVLLVLTGFARRVLAAIEK